MQLKSNISGKVQGVWFRAWARDVAVELGLTGYIRNRANGAVETLVQGEQEILQEFEDRMWDGPPLARVRDVASEWSEADENLTDFEIRR